MKHFAALSAFVAVLLPAGVLAAPHVQLVNSVAAVESHNGTLVTAPFAGNARPGQRLRYTIVAKNSGDHAAAKLTPMTKIPAGERYVGGSAGPLAEYSIDGGKTWSRQPMITVTNPDHTTTIKPALAGDYNAVRWLAPDPLAPAAHTAFSYDVIVE
jgi:uncharacterized repeat protein (TIGR01451 family)